MQESRNYSEVTLDEKWRGLDHTLDAECPGTLDEKGPPKEYKARIEIKDVRADSSSPIDSPVAPSQIRPRGTKSTARKETKPKVTIEDVQTSIDSLDLSKFRAKYPGLDIPNEHAKFSDYYLGGNQSNGKPNWQKWSDWSRAFHTWCRNAARFNDNRPGGRTTASQPAPSLPDLTHFTLD